MTMHKHPARGNHPALSRRAFFASAPLLAVGGVGIAQPDQTVESEIQALFRDWTTTRASADRGTEEECDDAVDRLSVLEERICALPSLSAADFAAKIVAWSSWGDFELPGDDHPIWQEARALLAQ